MRSRSYGGRLLSRLHQLDIPWIILQRPELPCRVHPMIVRKPLPKRSGQQHDRGVLVREHHLNASRCERRLAKAVRRAIRRESRREGSGRSRVTGSDLDHTQETNRFVSGGPVSGAAS